MLLVACGVRVYVCARARCVRPPLETRLSCEHGPGIGIPPALSLCVDTGTLRRSSRLSSQTTDSNASACVGPSYWTPIPIPSSSSSYYIIIVHLYYIYIYINIIIHYTYNIYIYYITATKEHIFRRLPPPPISSLSLSSVFSCFALLCFCFRIIPYILIILLI